MKLSSIYLVGATLAEIVVIAIYEISFRRKFEQRTIVPFCGLRVWLNLDFRPYSVQLG